MKRCLIGLLVMYAASLLSAKDCLQYGSRQILLCDNVVSIAPPPAEKDSVYHYWNYFLTVAGVRSAIDSLDTSRSCFTLLNNAFFTKPGDTVTGNLPYGLAHASPPPTGAVGEYTDYILYGKVSGSDHPTLELRLECADSRELVKSDTVALEAGFDPVAAGRTAATALGPLYDVIIGFEKNTRSRDGLNAIAPQVIFTSEKRALSEGESAPLSVKIIDVDGIPLDNWQVVFEATGGTCNPAVVTTNAQGTATSVFTASNLKVTALVTAMLKYVQPSGRSAVASVLPVTFQCNNPDGDWIANAVYTFESTSETRMKAPLESSSSRLHTRSDIDFITQFKNISPVAGTIVNDVQTYKIKRGATRSVESFSQRHWEDENGYIDEKGHYSTHAMENNGSVPIPVIRVSEGGYTVSIKQISASQTGSGESNDVSYFKGMEPEVSNVPYVADPDVVLSFSVTGKAVDTSYTTTDKTESGGMITTKTVTINQKYSWEDTACDLRYERSARETTEFSMDFTEITQKSEHTTLSAMLIYTGSRSKIAGRPDVAGGKNLVSLLPCRYNAATRELQIRYSTPTAAGVTFALLTMAGRQVAKTSGSKPAVGEHRLVWKTAGIPDGMYLLQMKAGSRIMVRSVVLVR